MKNLTAKIKKYQMLITIVLISICILGLAAAIGYRELHKKIGSANIFFNSNSDLPDPTAELRHGKINEKEPKNVIKIGKTYTVAFSVVSTEKQPSEYRYTVESKLANNSESFNLNPGEKKSFKIELRPTQNEKWTLNRIEKEIKKDSLDLSESSWLGERQDYEVVSEETKKTYAYLPVSIRVDGFGKILNLNITIEDIKKTPHIQEFQTIEEGLNERSEKMSIIYLGVKDGKLYSEINNTKIVYSANPQLFKVTLSKEKPNHETSTKMANSYNTTSSGEVEGELPTTISFWYVIE